MNLAELNMVLYYADFLSLKEVSHPVTDNCKYYFIHGCPINSAYIVNLEPVYDKTNQFFIKALNEYNIIKDKFGDEGVLSFIEDICLLRIRGSVDAKLMLKCIYQYESRDARRRAFSTYYNWLHDQKYYITTIDDHGDELIIPCTRQVYHAEKCSGRRKVYIGTKVS